MNIDSESERESLAACATRWAAVRTVFLDRDGVINRKMPEGQYVTAWKDFAILPGVPEAIASLNRTPFSGNTLRVLSVTNQRGVALGLYSLAEVAEIHAKLQQALGKSGAHIDAFYVCPHDKNECNCRKPLPGLFEQAAADYPGLDPAASVMIGDSLSDIAFGRNLGMQTMFINSGDAHQKPGASEAGEMADLTFASLPEAVNFLLSAASDGTTAQ